MKSKRFRLTIYFIHLFLLFGVFAVWQDVPLSNVAAFIGSVALPLLGYLGAESWRKSENNEKDNNKQNKIN